MLEGSGGGKPGRPSRKLPEGMRGIEVVSNFQLGLLDSALGIKYIGHYYDDLSFITSNSPHTCQKDIPKCILNEHHHMLAKGNDWQMVAKWLPNAVASSSSFKLQASSSHDQGCMLHKDMDTQIGKK